MSQEGTVPRAAPFGPVVPTVPDLPHNPGYIDCTGPPSARRIRISSRDHYVFVG
jgi:hypothetical protein